jgi:hypothetical protein
VAWGKGRQFPKRGASSQCKYLLPASSGHLRSAQVARGIDHIGAAAKKSRTMPKDVGRGDPPECGTLPSRSVFVATSDDKSQTAVI